MGQHRVNIEQAKDSLDELIGLAAQGQDVVINDKKHPSVKLVVCNGGSGKRVAGLHQGAIQMSDDFDESLDECSWSE